MILNRIKALRGLLADEKIDAVVVSKDENVHYFSGFMGDSTMLVISQDKLFLITDFRYTEQAQQQAPDFQLVEQSKGMLKKVAELLMAERYKKVGFEGAVMSFDSHAKLQKEMTSVELSKSVSLDKLRAIKEDEEISLIKKAVEISDKAFTQVLTYIRAGLSEKDVAAYLENAMRCLGSERSAFDTIVASGVRGILPHGTATDKIIENGDLVTMDFGAVYKGYHSDITRTICVGQADEMKRNVYGLVLKGQTLGVETVRAGISGKAVDAAVRELFDNEGAEILQALGLPLTVTDGDGNAEGISRYFGHGLGHSLGLEIHEEPRLSRLSKCEQLPVNTVITVEPGIYIPNWGGVRIEDTVLVKEGGAEPLTCSPKQLIEL